MRTLINKVLALFGVVVIVVPSSMQEDFWVLFIADLLGIALITVGVWGLGSRLFPDRRVYVGLRSEVDQFISLVRKLNVSNSRSALEASTTVDSTKVERFRLDACSRLPVPVPSMHLVLLDRASLPFPTSASSERPTSRPRR